MRVQLKVSGGIVYAPGLSQPITIDSDRLTRQEAEKLKRLVDEAHFFSLPPVVNVPAPGSADLYQYIITIDDGSQHHVVQAVDPIPDPNLQALVNYLRAHR